MASYLVDTTFFTRKRKEKEKKRKGVKSALGSYDGSGLEMTDILDYSQTMSRPLRVIYPGAVCHTSPVHVQESPKWDALPSATYSAFCLEAAQVPSFLKQTLTSAVEIPLKLKGCRENAGR
jgi:hypothetical protein